MGMVDRTQEFRQLLADVAASSGTSLADLESMAGATPQAQSELNAYSAEIGGEIHQASLKVQELRKLAKSKTIFNDRGAEIQELTFSVKQDIEMLNTKIEALTAKVKGAGSNKSYQAHSSNMLDTLKTRLLEVTKDFKTALEIRTSAMEDQNKRRSMYSTSQSAASNPFAQRPRPGAHVDDIEAGDGGGVGEVSTATLAYTNSRADAVQNVQRTIAELAQMFTKMADMVTAQEEMIHRIDHDLDDTVDNVNSAQGQLMKYFDSISSNTMLILKVFAILITFIVFFIVFIA